MKNETTTNVATETTTNVATGRVFGIFEYNDGWGLYPSLHGPFTSIAKAMEAEEECIENDQNPHGDSFILNFVVPTKVGIMAKEYENSVRLWANENNLRMKRVKIVPAREANQKVPFTGICPGLEISMTLTPWDSREQTGLFLENTTIKAAFIRLDNGQCIKTDAYRTSEWVPKHADIMVTRHIGLVEYCLDKGLISKDTKVLSHVGWKDVVGKHVLGVLPHHLSKYCKTYREIPLNLPPEMRGKELSVEDIRKYADIEAVYTVNKISKY